MTGQRSCSKTTIGRLIARIRNENNNPRTPGAKTGEWMKFVHDPKLKAGNSFDLLPYLKFNYRKHPAPFIAGIRTFV